MKILALTNRVPWPLNDGGNLASFHLLRGLDEKGEQIHLLSLNTAKHFVSQSNQFFKHPISTVDLDTSLSIIPALKALLRGKAYNIERFRSEKFEEELERQLRKEKYDIVQLEGSYMGLYIDKIRSFSKAKIVLRSHNIEHRIWQRLAANESNVLKSWYLNDLSQKIEKFERHQLTQLDAVVAISETDLEFYKAVRPNLESTFVPAGMDLQKMTKQKDYETTAKKWCFLGSLEWEPNVEGLKWFLKEIWPSLHQQDNELEFHIAGKNPPEELFNWQGNGVVFHGMVPNAAQFLLLHGPLVVPLLAGSGMRLKIVEAMSLGKPIISTSIGVEGIPLKHKESFFLANKEEDFLNALHWFEENKKHKEQLGNAARKLAEEQFDWANLVEIYRTFYRSLL